MIHIPSKFVSIYKKRRQRRLALSVFTTNKMQGSSWFLLIVKVKAASLFRSYSMILQLPKDIRLLPTPTCHPHSGRCSNKVRKQTILRCSIDLNKEGKPKWRRDKHAVSLCLSLPVDAATKVEAASLFRRLAISVSFHINVRREDAENLQSRFPLQTKCKEVLVSCSLRKSRLQVFSIFSSYSMHHDHLTDHSNDLATRKAK